MTQGETLALARRATALIQGATPDVNGVAAETVHNFAEHINRGILTDREGIFADEASLVEWDAAGARIRAMDGTEFVDFVGGYGVFLLGHQHARVVRAVEAQLRRSCLQSQELLDPLRGYLAALLARLTPGDLQKSYFVNSGSEAVEMALKLARWATGRRAIIAAEKGFHGQTLGALSATARPRLREPFGPLVPDFHHVPFGDVAAVRETLADLQFRGNPAAAVMVEPIQAEGGVNIPPADYWPGLRAVCDEFGALLIADEIQTGMGRTGRMFAVNHWDVVPDIMTLGKALGGGVVPIAAVIGKDTLWQKAEENITVMASSTFGGNPLCCAGAIAAIAVTLEEDIPALAAKKGRWLYQSLQVSKDRCPGTVVDVRGAGLLVGIEFVTADLAVEFERRMLAAGVLVGAAENGSKVIRLQPPAVIDSALLEHTAERIHTELAQMAFSQRVL